VRDHLANDRTLLAWQRTALGAAVALVGAWRFARAERGIDTATYHPALLAHLVLTGAIVAGAALPGSYLLAAR
jgi:uncharacterized membrane protein YidH (DUF202 family)